MKKIVLGIIIGILLTISTSVMAEDGLEKVEAYLRKGLPIFLDGKVLQFKDSALVLNGTTYLPFREMANQLGKGVVWNEKLQQIELYTDLSMDDGNQSSNLIQNGESRSQVNEFNVQAGFTPAIKINGSVYMFERGYDLFKDRKNEYYSDWSNSPVYTIVNVAYNNYKINATNNPYASGIITIKDDGIKFAESQVKYISAGQSYIDFKFHNKEINRFYEVSTKPDEEIGLFKSSNSKFLLPVNGVLTKLNIKYKVEVNESSKMIIFDLD
ncbi:Copper amine oxidase N-terminal domain-containing protein [Paenibacillus sp. 1_12]|uniref:stalk domain-containing protein n=1 Tax=Paenibacillus sp. 1_12 TaxID=1566278 RepID=UPI0008EA5F1C|nr:stalk domain-containing protein [Paenibacillus sp. 1_12]SFM44863.1 Copper amine oxidase N-terminal domain-containing protein [Paenibacillus sp. 1_12]